MASNEIKDIWIKLHEMRKLILSMQMSLDGLAVGPDNDMSWMQPDDNDQWEDLFSMLRNVDLFLLGRGMWAEYRDYWKKALKEPGFSKSEVKYARLAEKTKHIVFSQTLKSAGWENTTISNKPVEKEVARLKKLKGKDIQIVGGARFAGALIESGLIDEYRLFVNPAIIAKGKSFFQKLTKRHALALIEVRQLHTGVVLLRYKQGATSEAMQAKPEKRRAKNNPAQVPEFMSGLSKPAQRALINEGIKTLKKLASYTAAKVLSLHGMGPASLPVLRKALSQEGLTFRKG